MAISIGATTVPAPTTQRVRKGHRGASYVMADGSLKTDIVNASAKAEIALSWQNISTSDKDAILTGYAALATASATYTDHAANTWTVTQPEGLPPVDVDEVNAAAARWNVSLNMREV